MLYEFQFFDAEGGRPSFDFSDCGDDRAAAREALARLDDHTSCQGVEIYEGERLVGRLRRPPVPGPRPGLARLPKG